jgi:hypothetical protein
MVPRSLLDPLGKNLPGRQPVDTLTSTGAPDTEYPHLLVEACLSIMRQRSLSADIASGTGHPRCTSNYLGVLKRRVDVSGEPGFRPKRSRK